jgi:murein tripeptide amidase MpaA
MNNPQKLFAGILLFASPILLAQSKAPTANAAPAPADWRTPAEICDYRCTPRYDETMAYIRRVAAAAPKQVKIEAWGKTGEGRELVGVVVSKDGVFDPAAIHKADRPVVYIQNGIHPGEIEGKDASLALLRDMVVNKTRASLLDRAVVIIVPVYNIDGHERVSRYNRINQNGPEEMGWRTQSNNLNLNRDYLKADTVETRQFLAYFTKWLPDFFIDDHVTDGADYQYDVTYSIDFGPDVDPALAAWQRDELKPFIEKSVNDSGHLIGLYVGVGEANPVSGLKMPQDEPRYSTGYMILQNRPGLLVEMHMLKDYKMRVGGNYEILRAILEKVNADADKLVKMNRAADAATVAAGKTYDPARKVAVRTAPSNHSVPFHYLGYKRKQVLSEVSGSVWTQYTHEPENYDIPLYNDFQATLSVTPPRAYIVPGQWTRVIEVLHAHGVQMQPTTSAWESEVETYRCDPHWHNVLFEGHHPMAIGDYNVDSSHYQPMCKAVKEKLFYPAGSMVVALDQRLAKVAIHWLEPDAPDSAVQWGFFDAIFEQKEYGEPYVLERLAREMLAKDPTLKAEFEKKLAEDKDFAGDSYARLSFFFDRSPYHDPKKGLYPVGRLTTLDGVPVK